MTANELQQTVLVVDDEAPARNRLLALVDRLQGFTAVGQAANGEEALLRNSELQPDIVLLDIRMPGMDGLQVARHLAAKTNPPAVIFCTAFDEHAVEAFTAQAIGYLLKPVKQDDLETVLRASQRLNRAHLTALGSLGAEPEQIDETRRCVSARTHNGYQLIPVDTIRAFVADNKYVSAFYPEGEVVLDDTLRDLELEFPEEFVRVHRNALVARRYISGMEKQDDSYVLALDGVTVRPVVSRRQVSEIRRLIKAI